MLDKDEAVTLASLLEELAAAHPADPLSAPALRAAALLRHRAAAGPGQAVRSWHGDPWTRREAGETRDDAAGSRDTSAAERDRRAGERDDLATQRRRQADTADEQSRASEQLVRDLLWDAELRDKAAVEGAAVQPPASDGPLRRLRQLDREIAEAGRAYSRDEREAIREMLSQSRAMREAAAQGRYADALDYLASELDRSAAQADRQAADRDRQAARADRDQAIIDTEEQDPS
jgi:hypothetical protein